LHWVCACLSVVQQQRQQQQHWVCACLLLWLVPHSPVMTCLRGKAFAVGYLSAGSVTRQASSLKLCLHNIN
jgi:hypothetical protein